MTSGPCEYAHCPWDDQPAPYQPETWVYVHEWCSFDWAKRSAEARKESLTLRARDTTAATVVDDDDPDKLRNRGVFT